jgi:hypothetical protein
VRNTREPLNRKFREPRDDQVRCWPAGDAARGQKVAQRPRPVSGRHQSAGAAVFGVSSVAACACQDQVDRVSRCRAGRQSDLHGPGLCGRPARHAEGGDAAKEGRWVADVRAAAAGAGRGSRSLRRRPGRDDHCGVFGAGKGRRRAGRDRLRAVAPSHLDGRCGAAGGATGLGREPRQHLPHL